MRLLFWQAHGLFVKIGTFPQTTYAGITRIRFEGLGRRYAPISAGLRQRPLELSSFIIRF